MSNEISKTPIKDFFSKDLVKSKLNELLGKNAATFATSVLQVVNSNSMLANADPASVFSAACMAATLDLPINNALGFAYIVPFQNRKAGKTEAQFQLGYKGFVQLAQRSGQFKKISSAVVYEGQLVSEDPLSGYVFDWSNKKSDKAIGYVAYFQLLNGFEAYLYMTKNEASAHAMRYSQTFKKGFGVWNDNFDAMALKTVLKLLLSKQAPLSIQMQTAIQADQAVIKDIDKQEFEYIDNATTTALDALEPPPEAIANAAREAAQTGTQSFNEYFASLQEDERKQLMPILNELKSMASEANSYIDEIDANEEA